jgi:uncharacterized protein
MSSLLRRADRVMSDERALDTLRSGYKGHLATVSEDGSPYCIPILYVWMDGEIHVHTTAARGHLRTNIERESRVCFTVDHDQGVFDYGRFECDSGLAYASVVVFGRMRFVEDRQTKQRFCEALIAKYGKPDTRRPRAFYPRLDVITVYVLRAERMTGKEQVLPPMSEQWPAKDRTKTPNARPPQAAP